MIKNFWGIGGIVFLILAILYLLCLYRFRRIRRDLERKLSACMEELRQANERIDGLSHRDDLTGAGDRRKFDDAWKEEWRRAVRSRTPLALVILDVDHFKSYNEALGYEAGNECLRKIAAALMEAHRRAGELVARHAGGSFSVLIPGADRDSVLKASEIVRTKIQGLKMPHPRSPEGVVTVSLSAASLLPAPDQSSSDFVTAVENALYFAKASGRNRTLLS